jgi:hypothetical protein
MKKKSLGVFELVGGGGGGEFFKEFGIPKCILYGSLSSQKCAQWFFFLSFGGGVFKFVPQICNRFLLVTHIIPYELPKVLLL